MPDTFSPVVSLANLNQVYTYLDKRIESLNTVYNPKGSCTKTEIDGKNTHNPGDVWNITDSFTNKGTSIPADTNWVYVATDPQIDPKNYFPAVGGGYWVRVGSFLDIARDDKAGLICTGTDLDSSNNANGTSFDRGLKLKTTTNKAYITIPAASTGSYGVVTTGAQSFTGNKTLTQGDLTVSNGNVNISGTVTTTGGTATTATLLTDTLKVQNLVDVQGTFTTANLTAKNAAGTANIDVTWKPDGTETALILQTDQITASNSLAATSFTGIGTLSATNGSTANNVTLTNGLTKIDTQTITLGNATGLSAQSFTGIGALSAKTGSGTSETYNNITLSHATTEIDTPLLDVCYPDPSDSNKSLGNIEAQSFTGIGTLSATKNSTANNITLSHATTEIDTPKIALSGANGLSAATFSGISTLDASSKNITLNNSNGTAIGIDTAQLTASSSITMANLTATGKTITLGQNTTLTTPAVQANGSLVVTGTLTANEIAPGTDNTFNVTVTGSNNAVTAGTLNSDTVSATSLNCVGLTVSNNVTAASLGAKTENTSPAISADTVSVGTLSLTATNKTLTVNSSVTAASLAAQTSGNNPAISADTVSVGTLTLATTDHDTLTVNDDSTANTLNAGTLTATTANVGTLSASGKIITVNTSGQIGIFGTSASPIGILTATTANVGTLSASGKPITVTTSGQIGAFGTSDSPIGTLTATTATVGTLSASGTTATITGSVSAQALNVPNGAIQVSGSGTAMTVGTLSGGTAATGATQNFLTLGNSNLTGTGTNINNFTNPTKSSSFPLSSASLCVYGGGSFKGGLEAAKVFNAVWNDISDRIEIDIKPEPGYAYALKDGHYQKTSKYMDQGYIGIESDTSGFEMGGKNAEYELNAAVAGFVLAYVDKVYKPGTPLTVTKDGKLTKIKALGRILHPEMVVATFWKPELKPTFGPEGGEKQVKGRMWVKIK